MKIYCNRQSIDLRNLLGKDAWIKVIILEPNITQVMENQRSCQCPARFDDCIYIKVLNIYENDIKFISLAETVGDGDRRVSLDRLRDNVYSSAFQTTLDNIKVVMPVEIITTQELEDYCI